MIFQKFCKNFSLEGEEISLEQLLIAREERAFLQQECLEKYQQTLLSVTLTAVGGVKKNELLDYIFARCLENLSALFKKLDISPTVEFIRPLVTGHEAIFVLPIDAVMLKRACIELEDSSPLARLWDIDVISPNGVLLSRTDLGFAARSCLCCTENAKFCARSRKHSVEQIVAQMQQRASDDFFAQQIAEAIYQALLQEVYLTPKPGLVDRRNNGAHKDMNVQTFERSALALRPFFAQFILKGIETSVLPESQILTEIRPLGMAAENAMLQVTNGVNTHKGAIFAFGLVCCAIGRLYIRHAPDKVGFLQLFDLVRKFSKGLTAELQNYPENLPLTHGVKLYRVYGLTGARGEAESGLITVVRCLAQIKDKEQPDLHQILLWLMAHNDDTNVVHRGGIEGLTFVKQQAAEILRNAATKSEMISALEKLDNECIRRNISCGGSADLLALMVFLLSMER
ncbi:triphosphoribosyl-dephospho-CoA synthase CitG [Actinobacillus equuli]|uniref:triphosphoribosyl-dephospho-CoA synthase CitG n=1 Tax=Actinobacillus equuli TaxID=718 RepID=UPI0024188AE3|nr:triphosphoribosyl-dephospho-CoA synthase CitG [Actinobacillus equuli]MDG4952325.1 triphosphoribosyl-dephospho-CoA synthase CitG [Actinobacillus equuli subsp. equuli]WGE49480.1 triphosphoribosyl-dephospho-CoA synthase CitG [Actinobacillus equuli subsp. equuli]